MKKDIKKAPEKKSETAISTQSFVMVVIILTAVLVVCGALSYIIPQGSFLRDESGAIIPGTFEKGEVDGIALWRVVTAPVRVFFSEDALTVIMICVFLLVMSGVFNLIEKTGGIRTLISHLMRSLKGRSDAVICIIVLVFMLFGSFFGMYEELITLIPVVIMFSLSMGMDTMTGLGAGLMAACFGFSAAMTNPFSVGLASKLAGVGIADGIGLRIVFFAVIYTVLCAFLLVYIKRIKANPKLSITYDTDILKKEEILNANNENVNDSKLFKVFAGFFGVQLAVIILIAVIRAISDYAIVILAASFLIGGIISGLLICEKKRDTFLYILEGMRSMIPAIVMLAIASSVKLVMSESGILDTIMNYFIGVLDGQSKFFAIVLIYFLIIFLQLFIGSASAKIILIMPIILPIAAAIGLSPEIVIFAYCMADGFSDVFLPTNPVLLIALSVANISYTKWVKWTWKLHLAVFVLSLLFMFIACTI